MKAIVVLLGLLLLGAAVEAIQNQGQRTATAASLKAKAGGVKDWLASRASKFVAKLGEILAKIPGAKKVFDENNNQLDAAGKTIPFNAETASAAIAASLTAINGAADTTFAPTDASLKGKLKDGGLDDTHAAIFAEANDLIDPTKPLSGNPDGDIDEAVAGGSGSESHLLGVAAKGLTHFDAAAAGAGDMTPPSDAEIGTDGEDGDTVSTSFMETEGKAYRRRRKRAGAITSFTTFVKTASGKFVKALKSLKSLMPQGFSAGIGGNAGPLGLSIDVGFDMNIETFGAVLCYGAVFGTDSIGIGGNYHQQILWYGSKLNAKVAAKTAFTFDDVWGGPSAGVTAAVGLTAAGFPISVGGAIGWGAPGLADAWSKLSKSLTDNAKGLSISNSAASNAKIAFTGLKADIVALKDAFITAITGSFPNAEDPIVANAAIGVGLSPATLAAGGDILFNSCSTKGATKTKLWKLLLGLFLVSGPAGAVAGLFSWMTYHSDLVTAAFKTLAAAFGKIGTAITSVAAAAKNFWIAKVMPATAEVLAKLTAVDKAAADALSKAAASAASKIAYFFPKGNFLTNIKNEIKAKFTSLKTSVINGLKDLFSKKKF